MVSNGKIFPLRHQHFNLNTSLVEMITSLQQYEVVSKLEASLNSEREKLNRMVTGATHLQQAQPGLVIPRESPQLSSASIFPQPWLHYDSFFTPGNFLGFHNTLNGKKKGDVCPFLMQDNKLITG